MKKGNIIKNAYFVSIGQAFQKVLAFVLIPIAARYLGDEGFGIYSLATAIMYFVFLFNDLGINTFITREVSKNKERVSQYYFNSLFLKFGLTFVDFMLLIVFFKLSHYPENANAVIFIFAIYGILTSVAQLSIGIFQAYERMEFEALILVLEKLVTTGLGIWVLTKGLGLIAFSYVFVIGGLVSVLISIFILKRNFNVNKIDFKLKFEFTLELLKDSMLFGASMLLATIYNYVGILILSFMKPAEVIGWYSAAFKLLTITNIIPTILLAATFPTLSREVFLSKEKIAELFTKCFKYLSFLVFPLVVGTIILAKKIILLIFGTEFVNSYIALQILVWAAALIFYNIFLGGLLKAANYQRQLVKIQFWAFLVNVILNLIFIYKYSYIGAAIVTVGTEALIFIACLYITYQRITRLREIKFLSKSLISLSFMAIFCLLFKDKNVIVVIGTSIVIYFSILYLLKGFVIKEILPITAKGLH